MAKRVAYSLLFVKSDIVARADFGPLPDLEPLGFWQQPQSGNTRLYYSIGSLLEFGGKCGRSVYVIAEEFWTQTLSLPAMALAGLNNEQIRKAIGFDVEALTNVAGSASAIGFCKAAPSDESENFWVTQIGSAVQNQIQTAIETAGGGLAGLVHPGGLPTPVSTAGVTTPAQSWRRIEVWKDTTLCIAGRGDSPQRVRVINGDATQEAWRTTVSRWITNNDADLSEWLGSQGIMAGDPALESGKSWNPLPTLAGDVLKNWLMQWARELCSGAVHVPIVESLPAGAFTRKRIVTSAMVAAAFLILCVCHGLWLNQQETAAELDLSHAGASRLQLVNLERQAASLRADLQRRQKQSNASAHTVKYDPASVDRQRLRLDGLLQALAEKSDGTVVIDRIASESAGVVLIEGHCLPANAVDDFTNRLATVLPARGWDVSPAEKAIPSGSSVDGPGEFRLRVYCEGATGTSPVSNLHHGGG
jgi:hypothetical protein